MNIYEIKIEWCGGSRYAWASGFGPIADNINNMPFLKDAPDTIKKMKVDSWKVNPRPPGLKFETQGSEGQAKIWPDLLGCGGGSPHIFLVTKLYMI